MTPNEQLALWVKGKSVHNHDRWYEVVDVDGNLVERKQMDGGECCPDFSCCQPRLKWTEEQRKLFASRPDVRDSMLAMAVGALVAHEKDVVMLEPYPIQ